MGQQQLLLVLLGVIVVGIAVAIGITMFTDNSVSANRDALTTDLAALATRAQTYFRRPRTQGGGQSSFMGLTINKLTSKPSNANGTYVVTSVAAASVVLDATGMEIGSDGSKLSVTMTVLPDSTFVTVNN